MGRRVARNDGLRRLLIAERERSLERWPPSRPDGRLASLRAGESVVVSAAELLRVSMGAGLPYRQYAYGSSDWEKVSILGENDRLVE